MMRLADARWWQITTHWFYARTPSEQRVLGVGALVVVLLLFWQLVWDPVTSTHEQMRLALPVAREQAAQFTAQALGIERLPAPAATGRGSGGRSPQAAIEASAARAALGGDPPRVEAAPGGRVLVRVGPVSFKGLMGWVARLASDEGYRVDALNIIGAGEGRVKVERLLLAPAGTSRAGIERSAGTRAAPGGASEGVR